MLNLLEKVALEPDHWLDGFVRYCPGSTGLLLRRMRWQHQLAALGPYARFEIGTLITGGKNVSIGSHFSLLRHSGLHAVSGSLRIGDRVSINSNVCIDACDNGQITIGDDVLIGPNVVLRASDHLFSVLDKPINQQGHTGGCIVIEDDVWLGANVVVVPNVTIAAHSVVAAGAVVTHDVESGMVVGGVPARLILRRK